VADAVRQIADRLEPVLRDAFLAAVARTRGSADEEALADAIRTGHADDALRALGIEGDDFPALVAALAADRDGFNDATVILFLDAGTETAIALTYLFDQDAANVTLERLRLTLIQTIASESAKAVRDTLAHATRGTINPATIARQVREAIGLTPGQAHSVNTLRNALEEAARRFPVFARRLTVGDASRTRTTALGDPNTILRPDVIRNLSASQRAIVRKAIATGQLSPESIDDIAESQRKALLRHRALAIAGTEATRFANAGQQEAWEQAARRGVIDRQTARRFWVTAGDERVRHSHRAVPGMNPNGVAIDQPFKTPLGATMYPPLEISCRCRVVLREVGQ
jgi:hypothetical protein